MLMQWNLIDNGGFFKYELWEYVNFNYKYINVK